MRKRAKIALHVTGKTPHRASIAKSVEPNKSKHSRGSHLRAQAIRLSGSDGKMKTHHAKKRRVTGAQKRKARKGLHR